MLKKSRYTPMLALALIVLGLLLIVAACAAPPQGLVMSAPVQSKANGPEPAIARGDEPRGFEEVVVSTEWVAERLEDPNVRLIEVSVNPGLYERGHVPGAVNFVWHTDFVD
jgi:thiosulfate/3-mercaptopyruvate sulfurtransferase